MTTGTFLNSTVGPYRLIEFLGAGGMGEVYRAIDPVDSRSVAIKLLTQVRTSHSFRARFANEARIHSSLEHPNIARMIGYLEHNGTPAIVMEYVDGETIEGWGRRHGALPLERAIQVALQLVSAVGYLARLGIVHRDIKATNVKLNRDGGVKLLDFGIAKGPDSPSLTADGSVIGTLQSLAPEQLVGAPADLQTEIWALGVLLYEMLTSEHPFAVSGAVGITDRIRSGRYRTATRSRPELPQAVDTVLARCLAVDPRQRYATCEAFATDLVRLVRPAPAAVLPFQGVVARLRGDLPGSSLGVRLRRHLPLAAAGTAALAALIFLLTTLSGNRASPAEPDLLDVAPITAGTTTPLRRVTVNTINGSADVWRDGGRVGETPYQLTLPLGGEVQLTLKRVGYHDEEVHFTVTEGRDEYSFVLRPSSPESPRSSLPSDPTLLLGLGWFGLPWRRRVPASRAAGAATIDRPAFGADDLGVESRVVVATASDPGCIRSNNEDTVRVVRPPEENGPLLALVCDGMGGHAAGEQASRIAADTIAREYNKDGDPGEMLARAVRHANREIFETAQADSRFAGMGTTCTAIVLRGGLAWCAHVGDSRCYLLRAGELFVMTEDHSAVMALVREGAISREEARAHPDKNVISRALGSHAEIEVATWPRPFVIRPGDRFLLSSDGLHDVLSEPEILEIASTAPPHLACAALVAHTRAAGAPDNVSVVMLALPDASSLDIATTRNLPVAS